MKKTKKQYSLYILKCKDGTLYCGITNNLENRIKVHNNGHGSNYVRSRGGGKLVYQERKKNKSSALKREYEIKQLSRSEKLKLIKSRHQ